MTKASTLMLELVPETAQKLRMLAQERNCDERDIAATALSTYVDYETGVAESIRQGLADLEAGRVISHAAAMAEIDEIVEAVGRQRS